MARLIMRSLFDIWQSDISLRHGNGTLAGLDLPEFLGVVLNALRCGTAGYHGWRGILEPSPSEIVSRTFLNVRFHECAT